MPACIATRLVPKPKRPGNEASIATNSKAKANVEVKG